MENFVYRGQKRIWSMLRKNKLDVKHKIQTIKVTTPHWENYIQNLYSQYEIIPNTEDIIVEAIVIKSSSFWSEARFQAT